MDYLKTYHGDIEKEKGTEEEAVQHSPALKLVMSLSIHKTCATAVLYFTLNLQAIEIVEFT